MGIFLIVAGLVLVVLGGRIGGREMKEKGYEITDSVPADGSVVSPASSGVVFVGYVLIVVGIVLLVAV